MIRKYTDIEGNPIWLDLDKATAIRRNMTWNRDTGKTDLQKGWEIVYGPDGYGNFTIFEFTVQICEGDSLMEMCISISDGEITKVSCNKTGGHLVEEIIPVFTAKMHELRYGDGLSTTTGQSHGVSAGKGEQP